MDKTAFLSGQLLLAMPGMSDPRFARAVIAMCGFVIHSCDWGGQDTIEVAGLWALSSTIDVLRAIAEGKGPSQWVVALGYAGWDSGQIEGELARPGWFNVAGAADLVFDTNADERWSRAFERAGVDPRLLVADTGTA
jgi:putative transcriptional regulator